MNDSNHPQSAAGRTRLLSLCAVPLLAAMLPSAAFAQDAEAEAAEPLPEKQPFFQLDLWDAYAELGINGSSGNNERLNLIAIGGIGRETVYMETNFDALYTYATDEGDETENRFLGTAGNTWLLPESKWRYYVRGLYELDEFQDWDYRIRLSGGVGYELIDTDDTLFVLRAGAGVLREFGGEEDDWIPELNFGYDFEHKINDRASIESIFDYYPRVDDFEEFRIEFSAGLKVDITDDGGLYLSAGILDQYDSDPGDGFDRNDIDYYVTLGAQF
ncbi:MAG: DUF481 domain-containing protein [Planctomycetota bacterium]